MKKLFTGFILTMMYAIAFAMPSPKQIEDALAAKHYSEARGMVQEVLREKPESARAHLLNAYILIHADKNKQAANAELNTAAALDKKGDVKNSPLFGRIVTEIEMTKVAAPMPVQTYQKPLQAVKPVQQVSYAQPAQQSPVSGAGLVMVIVAIGSICAFCVLVYLLFREKPAPVVVNRYYDSGNAASYDTTPRQPSSGGFEHSYGEGRTRSAPQVVERTVVREVQPQVVMHGNPQGQGMGAFGTAASVAGGVVAGNMISDMLHSGHSHHSNDDYEDQRRRRQREADSANYNPAPIYTPEPEPVVSYESERSSFSSSNNNDSWGSDSYSSSDSSSSSWDSGSSDSSSSSWD